MNRLFANLLDKYLTHNVRQNNLRGYYINVMNNNEKEGIKIDTNHNKIFVRSEHNHTNITIMKYFDMGNNFKSFDDREWYYVICNDNKDLSVEIRKDLIDSWKETNAKDNVIILNKSGMVWDLPMSYFFFNECKNEKRWNNEGNVTRYFILPNPTFETNDIETVDNPGTVKYLLDSWKYLGHTAYAKYRTRQNSKQMLVAAYDSNGNVKGQHIMKSVGMVYGELGLDNYGALKTFQRKVRENDNEMFVTNKNGETFWISDRTWATAPTTIGETTIETTIETNTTDLATLALSIVENKPKRTIKRPDNYTEPMVAKRYEQVPNAFAALCESKPKRIIVRG